MNGGEREIYHHLNVVIISVPSQFVEVVSHTEAYLVFCWFVLR